MENLSLFLTYTQYFLDIAGVIGHNGIIEIGGRRMKFAGRLIQFFIFVEDGRGPPRGKPPKVSSPNLSLLPLLSHGKNRRTKSSFALLSA